MRALTLAAWRERARAAGGGDILDARFACPRCGAVATPRGFRSRGADPDRATRECVGRVDDAAGGCDWAAFGLLGTLGRGVMVKTPGGGEIEVFDFAPAPGEQTTP